MCAPVNLRILDNATTCSRSPVGAVGRGAGAAIGAGAATGAGVETTGAGADALATCAAAFNPC